MEKQISKINDVLEFLPLELSQAVRLIPEIERVRIQELRLRRGKFLTATLFGKEYFIRPDGKLVNASSEGIPVTPEHIDTLIKRAFHGSVHSYSRELARGYITISGGCRIGFCGSAVVTSATSYETESVKNISSVNIRIAREIIGCADELVRRIFSDGPKSLLIIGPPASGKTTILRDLCRSLGNTMRLSLSDERNEIAAVSNGDCQNDIGIFTDVFTSYSKFEAIMAAVRLMSPAVLVCDEIGSKEDLRALDYAVNSGVKLIATTHSPDYDDAKRRGIISKLIKDKVFDYACVLGTGALCGKVVRLIRIGND